MLAMIRGFHVLLTLLVILDENYVNAVAADALARITMSSAVIFLNTQRKCIFVFYLTLTLTLTPGDKILTHWSLGDFNKIFIK